MRKLLMASAAILGASGTLAVAQTPVRPVANQSQGQLAAPYGAGPAANNNNNAWGIANTPTGSPAAGPLSTIWPPNVDAVPAPGTIVIRLNGRVEVDMTANFTTGDSSVNAEGAVTHYKLNPLGIGTYMRLYPGFDGVAANGLRYGASIELRENFGPANNTFGATGVTLTSSAANSPSANSSQQTVFVRRAFTYLASDQAGIVRFGQGDGVIGLFDPCIFSSQCWDAGVGNFNGGALQDDGPSGTTAIPFVWLAQAGADYGNSKIVYLSPQFYGFDIGVQYAPNQGNSFSNEGLGVGCTQAGPTCINVSSGNDPTRWINQVGAGVRYQQTFGFVDFKAYGFYETAGKEDLTTAAYTVPTPTGGTGTLRYDNLSFENAAIAVTAYNLTAAFDYIGGALNGQLAMRPTGGAPERGLLAGLTYANGPITLGAEWGQIDSQGAAQLTGTSQRHEYEIAFGGAYKLAPGVQLVGEYMYENRHQGDFNFNANAVGPAANTVHAQGLMFSTVLTW